MCLTAGDLGDNMLLKTHQLLRDLDRILFISAQVCDQVRREAELTTLCASPAIDTVFLGQCEGVETTTCNLLDLLCL